MKTFKEKYITEGILKSVKAGASANLEDYIKDDYILRNYAQIKDNGIYLPQNIIFNVRRERCCGAWIKEGGEIIYEGGFGDMLYLPKKANTVRIVNCEGIKNIWVDDGTEIGKLEIEGDFGAEEIDLSKATIKRLSIDKTNIKNIKFGNITSFDMMDCKKLKTITGDELKQIRIYKSNIQIIKLNKLGKLEIKNCRKTTKIDIDVPVIDDILISAGQALKKITFNKSLTVNNLTISYCDALTTIDAPNMDCKNIFRLNELMALEKNEFTRKMKCILYVSRVKTTPIINCKKIIRDYDKR